MAITATTPLTVPAVEQEVFDKIWLVGLGVMAKDPNAPVLVKATIQFYKVLEDGSKKLASTPPVEIEIDDLFALTDGDGNLSSLPDAIVSAVYSIAQANGLV